MQKQRLGLCQRQRKKAGTEEEKRQRKVADSEAEAEQRQIKEQVDNNDKAKAE
jgi:hypothetical protein